ncbi:hypothetical protein F5B20DRAFT_577776 [Whalleya microplaca]|nr:hypothetical protein F5B20DRAFT_577776 [Whalleya microplaca]
MAQDSKEAHEVREPLEDTPLPPPPPPPLPPPQYRPPPELLPSPSPLESKKTKMAARFGAAEKPASAATGDVPTFRPCHFFFYGSLMDPEVVQAVTGLETTPILRRGSISGFKVKMWGIYPTLIPEEGGKVTGMLWKVDDPEHFRSLQQYETTKFKPCMCSIETESGEVLENSMAFCWAGDKDSPDLEDGTFDLERYQKNFKSSVVRSKHR